MYGNKTEKFGHSKIYDYIYSRFCNDTLELHSFRDQNSHDYFDYGIYKRRQLYQGYSLITVWHP